MQSDLIGQLLLRQTGIGPHFAQPSTEVRLFRLIVVH